METLTVAQECVSARSTLSVTESLTALMKLMRKIVVSFILWTRKALLMNIYIK